MSQSSDGGSRRSDATAGHASGFDEALETLVQVGRAAHRYGSSSPALERFLTQLAESFGYQGAFLSTPSMMVFALTAPDGTQRQRVVRPPGPGLDLDKLGLVGDVVDGVLASRLTHQEALTALEQIAERPPPFGRAALGLAYAMVGGGLAVLFGAGWVDTIVATGASLLVYAMVLASGRFGQLGEAWLPLATAFVAAFGAAVVKIGFPPLNVVLVVLSAVIVLVPGYSVSLGVIELVNRHVVSGMANLTGGLVYLVKQVAGGVVGLWLASRLLPIPDAPAAPAVPSTWLWVLMPAVVVGLVMIFQTPRRDFVAAAAGSLLAYVAILFGSSLADANIGNLLGTIAAMAFATHWSNRTRRPISIVLVPSIILLVSGSIGFRGLASIVQGQVGVGEQQFVQMFVVALTIAAGLLIGNTLFRPRASL